MNEQQFTSVIDKEQNFAFEVYPKRDLVITRGSGATLWDDKGNSYIDCRRRQRRPCESGGSFCNSRPSRKINYLPGYFL